MKVLFTQSTAVLRRGVFGLAVMASLLAGPAAAVGINLSTFVFPSGGCTSCETDSTPRAETGD